VGGSAGALDLRARITLTGDEVTIA
jgi:hypothetical protein